MFGGLLLFIGPGVKFKLRALYILGKCSTAGLYPQFPAFFFFFKICYLYFIICRHVCLHVGVCVCMRVKLSWEVRGIRYPGAGVIYGCDLPDMGSRSQTWVL